MVVGTILIFAFLLVFAISIIIIFVVITEQKSNPETCSSQLDCIQGYVCDGNQTCVPGLGTHCTSEDPCISPFVCSNNICVLGDDSELTNSMNPSSESIYYDFLPKVKSTKTFSNPTIRNIRETYASNGVSSEDNEGELMSKLIQLAEMRESGILSEDEFIMAKSKLLRS